MLSIFGDWQAQGITSILHEKRGGYANNTKSMYGLADKAVAEGVRILSGVEVVGFTGDNGSGAIRAVETNKGPVLCDYVIVGAGPWIKSIWEMWSPTSHRCDTTAHTQPSPVDELFLGYVKEVSEEIHSSI